MSPELRQHIQKIFLRQKDNYQYDWQSDLRTTDSKTKTRIEDELTRMGPLSHLIDNDQISEILVNGPSSIYYELKGDLKKHDDSFFSQETYQAVLDRLAQHCGTYLSREKPFLESQFGNLRITMIYPEIANGQTLLSIRKSRHQFWNLAELSRQGWCSMPQLQLIGTIFKNRHNFLVVGGTSSGKTTFLQALLQELADTERAVIIEDTQELMTADNSCVSLLTRQDPGGTVSDVSMEDLLKRALRLRPDRLVVGEIRGGEAKSLLLALSSGHSGSFGSLHANSAAGALLRLEMLIQMGAPQWNINSIRRLIGMTVQYIFVVEKKGHQRRLSGIYQVGAVEDHGLLLTRIDAADEDDF